MRQEIVLGIGGLRALRALGLRRMWQTVEHVDTPVLRGMITKVSHLVEVEEVES